ncbi:hypothetical protein JCGZ_24837 [Jatropha curcas]|uniref:Uncharacterized protein n=1 Tax=Jatropha curcas TaxID=180498 RepID=A0A067L0U2_JATCU|nr:hypothetical protein JCGZ_24837 [Jatropha curcas]
MNLDQLSSSTRRFSIQESTDSVEGTETTMSGGVEMAVAVDPPKRDTISSKRHQFQLLQVISSILV